MVQWHFEPVGRSKARRPMVWVARLIEVAPGEDVEQAFRRHAPYEVSVTVELQCLGVAEVKGLDKPLRASQFKALQYQLHKIGIEVMEIRRRGEIHAYEYGDGRLGHGR